MFLAASSWKADPDLNDKTVSYQYHRMSRGRADWRVSSCFSSLGMPLRTQILSALPSLGLAYFQETQSHAASKDRLHFFLSLSQDQEKFQRPLTHFSHLIGQNCVISTFLNQSLTTGFGLLLDQSEPSFYSEMHFQVEYKWRSEKNKGYLRIPAKSLHSCLTLCGPMDSSAPGSSVHGILQERILEWVARIKEGGKEMSAKCKPLTSTMGTSTCHIPL